jgi:AcrR family transcriptional regulator
MLKRKSVNGSHAPHATRAQPRRRRLGADDRRRAIMDAAKALFMKQGYAATSLEQVVARSGGSLATVYQLFGNKEGLWRALVAEFTLHIGAPLTAPSAHDDVRGALVAMALRLIDVDCSAETGGGIRLILAEGSRNPELARGLFQAGPDAGREALAAYFREEVAAGRLDMPDVELAATHFCHLIGGDLLLRNACGALPRRDPAYDRRRVESAVDLFLNAYRPRARCAPAARARTAPKA